MTGPAIELTQVFCVHRSGRGDAAALQGLDLRIARGESVAILGPSGAGKSTLLRVIAGLQIPSAGVVSLLGVDIGRLGARERLRARHAQIGFVGQSLDALPAALRIRDVVALPLALRGAGRAERRARARELLDAAGLGDRSDSRPGELSGGERQRVVLCAALAHRPAVLLADEPTGELDAASAAELCALIATLCRETGTTAVIASHDPSVADAADRVVVLRDGRVVESRHNGTTAAVIGQGGWLALAPALRAAAGIGAAAIVREAEGGLLVSAAPEQGERPVAPPHPGPPAPARPAAVVLRHVTRRRGAGHSARLVLDGLDHAFAPGRLTVVTGRSGSGKTTLLRLLAGLDVPDGGEVTLDGRSLAGLDREARAALRRTRIAYLSQEPAPVGFLSATEQMALALELRGVDRGAAVASATEALGAVGLGDRAEHAAARLSAGESQRLGLARAIACSSGLLLLDEPTSRLDRTAAVAVAQRLAALGGHTVICATHDPDLIAHAHEALALDAADRGYDSRP